VFLPSLLLSTSHASFVQSPRHVLLQFLSACQPVALLVKEMLSDFQCTTVCNESVSGFQSLSCWQYPNHRPSLVIINNFFTQTIVQVFPGAIHLRGDNNLTPIEYFLERNKDAPPHCLNRLEAYVLVQASPQRRFPAALRLSSHRAQLLPRKGSPGSGTSTEQIWLP
jgi:hypothetical protein